MKVIGSVERYALRWNVVREAFKVGGAPPFKPGQKYVLKVRTSGSAAVNYRFDVTIGK